MRSPDPRFSGGREISGQNGAPLSGISKGGLVEAARAVIAHTKGTFTIKDIERDLLKQNVPVKRPSLASVMRRLTGVEIEMVKEGSGRRPATYKAK